MCKACKCRQPLASLDFKLQLPIGWAKLPRHLGYASRLVSYSCTTWNVVVQIRHEHAPTHPLSLGLIWKPAVRCHAMACDSQPGMLEHASAHCLSLGLAKPVQCLATRFISAHCAIYSISCSVPAAILIRLNILWRWNSCTHVQHSTTHTLATPREVTSWPILGICIPFRVVRWVNSCFVHRGAAGLPKLWVLGACWVVANVTSDSTPAPSQLNLIQLNQINYK